MKYVYGYSNSTTTFSIHFLFDYKFLLSKLSFGNFAQHIYTVCLTLDGLEVRIKLDMLREYSGTDCWCSEILIL